MGMAAWLGGRMELITDRCSNNISGVLSCYDRIVIQGIIPGICYTQGMTGYLYTNGIKIFDYPCFAEPFRGQLRENDEKIAKENNLEDEMGNNFNTRIEGTRIKHSMGAVSIKMYDKFGLILRIETTERCFLF